MDRSTFFLYRFTGFQGIVIFMKKLHWLIPHLFLLIFPAFFSCNHGAVVSSNTPGSQNPHSWNLQYTNGFLLMNAPVETNRFYLVIEENLSGSFEYIIEDEDLIIENTIDFNQASQTPVPITVESQRDLWDSSIDILDAAGNRFWAFAGREYHLWIRNTVNNEITHLQCAVPENLGAAIHTGTLFDNSGNESLEYHVSLPAEYSESVTWPLILTIQAPDFVERNHHFPAVCVYIPTGHTHDDILAQIPGLVAQTVAQYSIDPERIFAWGYSAGGCSAMEYVNEETEDSYDFSALVVIGISWWLEYHNDNLGDVDAWLLYGEYDSACGPDTLSVYNDMPSGTGDHRLSIIPGTGHGDSNNPPWQNPFIFNWLFDR